MIVGLIVLAAVLGVGFITMPGGYLDAVPTRGCLEGYEDYKTYTKSVNASASLETILGEALPAAVVGITLIDSSSATVLNYQCDGTAASATSVGIPAGSGTTLAGNKAKLDKVRLYTGAATDIGFIVHTLTD